MSECPIKPSGVVIEKGVFYRDSERIDDGYDRRVIIDGTPIIWRSNEHYEDEGETILDFQPGSRFFNNFSTWQNRLRTKLPLLKLKASIVDQNIEIGFDNITELIFEHEDPEGDADLEELHDHFIKFAIKSAKRIGLLEDAEAFDGNDGIFGTWLGGQRSIDDI